MKKTSFSFRAVRCGSSLYRFFVGKKNKAHNTHNLLRKTALALAASVAVTTLATAQCDTFRNADAANPLRTMLDATKKVAGFAFADIDGDGDEDVYVDYLGKPEDYGDPLHLFKNVGTKTHPVFEESKNTGFGHQHAGGQNGMMQFVDIDGDGDLDFFRADSTASYYGQSSSVIFYKNIGTPAVPHFVPAPSGFLPPLYTNYIQPFAFADVDGDGDYDLYASEDGPYILSAYYQRVYYNRGTKTHPVFNEDDYTTSESDEFIYRTYYDWNKDGLLDYFDLDARYAFSYYYRNTGSKEDPHYVKDGVTRPKFNNGTPYRMVDLNNDGEPEVFDFNAHYSTLAPVAMIVSSLIRHNGEDVTVLRSQTDSSSYYYRWEYNGNTIAGATKNYLLPQKAGTYTLYITDGCGTGVSLNYELKNTAPFPSATNSKTAGFANDIGSIGIKAYPNPFVNSFTLKLPGNTCTVKMTDMAGRVLQAQTTSATTLQTGGKLKEGSYIVEVWQGKEMIYKTTVVKR